ncbi:uncharacterized protein LOC135218634 [Macrobrachium nipponense]|uniref:uncharacterized protein LOC135218634 n=1 Tax=Macrobrachium nipponense TaxID=159736 RepID=UPI0030C8575A
MNIGYLMRPQGILKMLEIVFVIVAFGVFRGGKVGLLNLDVAYFTCGVLVTALIITPLLLVCYIMGATDIQKTILEIPLNFLLFVLMLTAGSVTLKAGSEIVAGGSATVNVNVEGTFKGFFDNVLEDIRVPPIDIPKEVSSYSRPDDMAMGSFCILASVAYFGDFVLSLLYFKNK